jgi:hypothetical protein
MKIIEVGQDKKLIGEFLKLPVRLYKDVPQWIRPMNQDVEAVFDEKKNKKFRTGFAKRWLLVDDSGKTIGRIAAFYDQKQKENQPTGGMGFFEVENNGVAARLLLQTAQDWLVANGMEAMDGPVNFGDRDRWWGLLLDGFEHEPNYCMGWHHEYYRGFLEDFGFKLYYRQFTYFRDADTPLQDSFKEKAQRMMRDSDVSVRMIDLKQLPKFTEDFRTIYNAAWGKHSGVAAMSSLQAKTIMKTLKPIIDTRLMFFAYHGENPAAMFIMLPEMNQIFKHIPNGNFNWFGKLLFLYHQKMGTCRKMFGVVFGVVPEWQGKGMESVLILESSRVLQIPNRPYDYLEMNWIGEFNPKMMHICENLGASIRKTHGTFRKLFKPDAVWVDMPVIR